MTICYTMNKLTKLPSGITLVFTDSILLHLKHVQLQRNLGNQLLRVMIHELSAFIYNLSISPEVRYRVNFLTCKLADLQNINFDFTFTISTVGIIHGVGIWFDAYFCGTERTTILSTSPSSTPTHWYQTRLLLSQPIAVNPGQSVSGNISMIANKEQTLDVKLTLGLPTLNVKLQDN